MNLLSTLIFALIPIFVTIGLGYLAARRGIFNGQDSKRFVKLVLTFMLPLHVFGGLWGTSRRILIENVPLMGWLMLSMTVCYLVMILVYRFGFKNSRHVDCQSVRAVYWLRRFAIIIQYQQQCHYDWNLLSNG